MKEALITAMLIMAALPVSAAIQPPAAANEIAVWSFGADGRTPAEAGRFSQDVIAPGSSIALADFDKDGVDEILVGSGPGRPPKVAILRANGTSIRSFDVFDPGMIAGVSVAAGDVDGDGSPDVIAGSGRDAPARVMIYDKNGVAKSPPKGINPYGMDFRGGVFAAAADIDGDGKAEIITGAGPGGSPQIRIFSGDGTVRGTFFAFDESRRGGVAVAAGDANGDGKAEIFAALAGGGDGTVKTFDGRKLTEKNSFKAYGDAFSGGLSVAAVDVNHDRRAKIMTAPFSGGGPHVRIFDGKGRLRTQFFSHDSALMSGLAVAGGPISSSGSVSFLAVPQAVDAAKAAIAKFIDVDLSEQRLRAFERGALVRSFLISS
ncbi:MAG: FG-GAP-like repeat-containing protein, partial [Patescibacteria group bacterium]